MIRSMRIEDLQDMYQSTGRKVVIPEVKSEGRRSGNTTRQVDLAVQHLFRDDIIVCHDHAGTETANDLFYGRVIRRLIQEHSIPVKYIISDKRYLTIYLKFT